MTCRPESVDEFLPHLPVDAVIAGRRGRRHCLHEDRTLAGHNDLSQIHSVYTEVTLIMWIGAHQPVGIQKATTPDRVPRVLHLHLHLPRLPGRQRSGRRRDIDALRIVDARTPLHNVANNYRRFRKWLARQVRIDLVRASWITCSIFTEMPQFPDRHGRVFFVVIELLHHQAQRMPGGIENFVHIKTDRSDGAIFRPDVKGSIGEFLDGDPALGQCILELCVVGDVATLPMRLRHKRFRR